MNRSLKFYDYSLCYAHYTDRIMSIRQAKIRGEVIGKHSVKYTLWGL